MKNFELFEEERKPSSISVIGIGTVGCKIIRDISKKSDFEKSVELIFVHNSKASPDLEFEKSEKVYAIDDHVHYIIDDILSAVINSDIVFIVCGLGGETGSNVAPYLVSKMKENNVLCIGLVSYPFSFEGRRKLRTAKMAYNTLAKSLDSLICIENDKFLKENIKINKVENPDDIFIESNNHFEAVVSSMVNLVSRPGMINVEMNDLKSIISGMGIGSVGFAAVSGDLRSELVVDKLLDSPALSNHQIRQAKACLVCINSGLNLTLGEFTNVGDSIEHGVGEQATIVVGTVIDEKLVDEIEVVVVFTGMPRTLYEVSDELECDFVSILKTIEFEPHYASAGLSILSYFNEFIHQKYRDTKTKVRIEQNGNKVKLVIETPAGEVDSIERSLSEYGEIVSGHRSADQSLDNQIDVERLNMKLEMAAMELRNNEKLMLLYQAENGRFKKRVEVLEEQIIDLQNTICSSLSFTQKELSSELKSTKSLPADLIKIIQDGVDFGLDEERKALIEEEVLKYKNDSGTLDALKTFLENTIYGVSGNAAFSFISGVLNGLPK